MAAASKPRRMDPDVLTVRDVAKMLGLGDHAVYDAAGRGDLPHRRLGKRILFSRAAIMAWLQGNRGG